MFQLFCSLLSVLSRLFLSLLLKLFLDLISDLSPELLDVDLRFLGLSLDVLIFSSCLRSLLNRFLVRGLLSCLDLLNWLWLSGCVHLLSWLLRLAGSRWLFIS